MLKENKGKDKEIKFIESHDEWDTFSDLDEIEIVEFELESPVEDVKSKKERDHKAATMKGINSNFNNVELSTKAISYTVDRSFLDNDIDEDLKIHYDMIFQKIHKLVENSEFKMYNQFNEKNQPVHKINKEEINKIYSFITNSLTEYSKLDLYSSISHYFDIDYVKFFNSLSNMFKEHLITELNLDGKRNTIKKMGKLF